MKVVIYAKLSSQNKIEKSIEEQIKTCVEYAKEKGYTIIYKYIDIDSRKQFEQMIKDSSKKKFQAVIVYSMDRFSRNKFESATYKCKLKQNGVKVVSTKKNIENDAFGILMDSIVEEMAVYYSQELNQKINADIVRKKRKKERIANEG